ncbi:MAG: phytase [Bacteroidia bacterium]|nr:phytase [Bacteroidia bacterium]
MCKKNKFQLLVGSLILITIFSCSGNPQKRLLKERIQPTIISEKTRHDTDDPAIWINYSQPEKSLILGTDKNSDGALYVFDLEGKIIEDKVVRGLKRPNNVDVEYGLSFGDSTIDIAIVTERERNAIRVFRLPDLQAIDNGGIKVFEGEPVGDFQAPMGIAAYHCQRNGKVYAIVGRKSGPSSGYLWQYQIEIQNGVVKGNFVRSFGSYSGKKEIESIAVDDSLGHVYYSDESIGVKKYHADPDSGDQELALFATSGFAKDHEGISIYPTTHDGGYILVSDQGANSFHVFSRNTPGHPRLAILDLSTLASDGSEITHFPLSEKFKKGLFVAMSDDKTFQYYNCEDLFKKIIPK